MSLPEEPAAAAAPAPIAGCEDLERFIEDRLVVQMRRRLDEVERLAKEPRPSPPSTPGAPPPPDPVPGETRNNQQASEVEEAGVLARAGGRAVAIAGGELRVLAWSSGTLQARSIAIEGHPRSVILDETGRLLVFSDLKRDETLVLANERYRYLDSPENGTVKLTVLALAEEPPRVLAEHWLPGFYGGAYRTGRSVRLVVTHGFYLWHPGVEPWLQLPADAGTDAVARAYATAKQRNEVVLRGRSLADWLPRWSTRAPGRALTEVNPDCGEYLRPSAIGPDLGVATVVTLDLDRPEQPHRLSIVTGWLDLIHASPTALYLTSRRAEETDLYKLDLASHRTTLAASGAAPGIVFALQAHEGALRVGNARRTATAEENASGQVTVFRERAGLLEIIGATPEIASGEQMIDARFIGRRGFVIVRRPGAPLYTVDLSDPERPRVAGELAAPGASTTLRAFDEDHLLALSTEPPEPESGPAERRLRLRLFDLSDLKNPKQTSRLVGTAKGWGGPKAKPFDCLGSCRLLGIPFADYGFGGVLESAQNLVSELRVFSVDASAGIESRGSLSLTDLYFVNGSIAWSESCLPWVRGGFLGSDANGDGMIFAISDAGARVVRAEDVSQVLATAPFDLDP